MFDGFSSSIGQSVSKTCSDSIFNELILAINVFARLMIHLILYEEDARVGPYGVMLREMIFVVVNYSKEIIKSEHKLCIQMASHIATIGAIHSASMEESAIVSCFMLTQSLSQCSNNATCISRLYSIA